MTAIFYEVVEDCLSEMLTCPQSPEVTSLGAGRVVQAEKCTQRLGWGGDGKLLSRGKTWADFQRMVTVLTKSEADNCWHFYQVPLRGQALRHSTVLPRRPTVLLLCSPIVPMRKSRLTEVEVTCSRPSAQYMVELKGSPGPTVRFGREK